LSIEGVKVANIKSSKKRNRQNERRRIKNSAVRSSIRRAAKKVKTSVESKQERNPQEINELFRNYTKIIDTASRKKIVNRKTAARKKSRLAKKVNSAT
jgi:small subunit ribosomal protein S20